MIGCEFGRCLVAQRSVRSELVVVPPPCGDEDTGLGQTRKPVVVQAFVAKSSVKALDERILGGLACLDQLESNAMLISPLIERSAGEFSGRDRRNDAGLCRIIAYGLSQPHCQRQINVGRFYGQARQLAVPLTSKKDLS